MSKPIREFTTTIPFWSPRVTPVELDEATEEQLDAMKITPSDTGVSEYVLVLAHDPLGRKLHAGFDRAGAERAFRKALELNPDDIETRGELAILLEHNHDGERYGPGADLDLAIDEYRLLDESLPLLSLENNLRVALMHSGRFKELLAVTRLSKHRRSIKSRAKVYCFEMHFAVHHHAAHHEQQC